MQNFFHNGCYIFYQWDSKERNLDSEVKTLVQQAGDKEGGRKTMNGFTFAFVLYVAGVFLLRCKL
jgi:predicted Ser/Thr protein kinase